MGRGTCRTGEDRETTSAHHGAGRCVVLSGVGKLYGCVGTLDRVRAVQQAGQVLLWLALVAKRGERDRGTLWEKTCSRRTGNREGPTCRVETGGVRE